MTLNVLSLFDGISCGQAALKKAKLDYNVYYSSEIDDYAIAVTQRHFTKTKQLGDISKWREWDIDLSRIDIIIGGSPCQDLSQYKTSINERKGLNGDKSGLFFHFVNILKKVKPKYFLLENVVMNKEDENIISNLLGVQPIRINSNLVCAAERKRLYWSNIPNVLIPEERGILLKDIIIPYDQVPEKYWYRDTSFTYNGDDKKVQATLHKKLQRSMKEVYNLN